MHAKIFRDRLVRFALLVLILPSLAYSLQTDSTPSMECEPNCTDQIRWIEPINRGRINFQQLKKILAYKRNFRTVESIEGVAPKIDLAQPTTRQAERLSTPNKVKGIYVTGYTFQNDKKMSEIIETIESTELNTIVIDIQDDAGYWMFPPQEPILTKVGISKYALDRETFSDKLQALQDRGIYTIVRVVTFQSPESRHAYPALSLRHKNGTIWQNWKGISWLDMTNPKAWEIPVAKAREAITIGFDEVQFDYIRFPSDGYISQIAYHDLPDGKAKHEVMVEFLQYLNRELEAYKIPLSADIFGFTYIRAQAENDLNIGQRVIDFAQYFDHLSPMVYPSHYPSGFLGLKNPALDPYTIVNIASRDGNDLINRVQNPRAESRPWLQYFNLGAQYDRAKIQAQIDAVEAYPNSGWIFWNPRNQYEASYFTDTPTTD